MDKPKQHSILVVDDDEGICDLLGKFLQKHGFVTELAHNADEMEPILQLGNTDLVILDILMPGKDGLTLCREIRTQSQIPIIMLTAISEDVDRILGLEMGADDYLSKPFNPRELLARVKAILRRSAGGNHELPPGEVDHRHTYLQFSNWTLDKTARRLFSPDELEISLSTGEYSLLLALLERAQQILSRDQLLDITKNRSCGPFDRSIDIQISRLRHKIEQDHKNPRLIKTVRGGGYVLATTVKMLQETEEEHIAILDAST